MINKLFSIFSANKDNEEIVINEAEKSNKFPMNRLLNDIYQSFRPRFKSGIIFYTTFDECSDYDVHLDRLKVNQIYYNFISNAIKYTKSGEISIGYDIVPQGIKIYVKDTGIGVSDYNKEFVSNIFSSSTELEFGRGFGLGICKKLSVEMNGEIGFDSHIGEGSCFWVLLPCQVEQRNNISDVHITVGVSKKISNPKILIAEDIDANFILVDAILKSAKYTNISRAVNGKEAADMCYRNDYDFIFMDIRMPIMDGVTAVDIIRDFNASIPIVALTANASDFDRKIEKDYGFDGAIVKPINKKMVIDVLQRFVY